MSLDFDPGDKRKMRPGERYATMVFGFTLSYLTYASMFYRWPLHIQKRIGSAGFLFIAWWVLFRPREGDGDSLFHRPAAWLLTLFAFAAAVLVVLLVLL